MRWLASFSLLIGVGVTCTSCSFRPSPETTNTPGAVEGTENTVPESDQGTFFVVKPYRATADAPFLLVLRLVPKAGCVGKNPQNHSKASDEEVLVQMDEDPQVAYEPQQFKTVPCKDSFVRVTVKKKGSGLASVTAYAQGYEFYSESLDVGFDGKVRVTSSAPLSYGEPGTLNVEVVTQDDKPISFDSDLSLTLQTVDAELALGGSKSDWVQSLELHLRPGARSSPPFQIQSKKFRGGTVHLSTSLSLGADVILSQENHSFDVAPVWWLPILMAIFGAVLYFVYSVYSDDKRENVRSKLWATLAAGVIAWLFTGFDLLGLKLDTNSLRTYAITGFLFCFLGVDVLLTKRFPRTVHTPKEK